MLRWIREHPVLTACYVLTALIWIAVFILRLTDG